MLSCFFFEKVYDFNGEGLERDVQRLRKEFLLLEVGRARPLLPEGNLCLVQPGFLGEA